MLSYHNVMWWFHNVMLTYSGVKLLQHNDMLFSHCLNDTVTLRFLITGKVVIP